MPKSCCRVAQRRRPSTIAHRHHLCQGLGLALPAGYCATRWKSFTPLWPWVHPRATKKSWECRQLGVGLLSLSLSLRGLRTEPITKLIIPNSANTKPSATTNNLAQRHGLATAVGQICRGAWNCKILSHKGRQAEAAGSGGSPLLRRTVGQAILLAFSLSVVLVLPCPWQREKKAATINPQKMVDCYKPKSEATFNRNCQQKGRFRGYPKVSIYNSDSYKFYDIF